MTTEQKYIKNLFKNYMLSPDNNQGESPILAKCEILVSV